MSGSFALAEEDADTVSACVVKSSGNVRLLLDGAGECRNGEVLVQWGTGAGSGGNPLAPLAEEKDENANGLVHWTQLFAVPEAVSSDHGLSDFIESLTTAPQTDSNDTGLVHWDNLFGIPDAWLDGVVSGLEIEDGSIYRADLAPGAVTSDRILDGTIEGHDIGAAQVTAGHLALDHRSAFDSTSFGAPLSGVDRPMFGAGVTGAGTYLISGQAQLTVDTPADEPVQVQYQLVRVVGGTAVAVSPAYSTFLSAGQPQQVASVAAIDTVATAGDTFFLRVSGPGITVSNTVLNVTELG